MELTLPNANVLPLRSANSLMPESVRVTKTLLKLASSSRMARRVAPLARWVAWTEVKPPYQTMSSRFAASPSTVAA